MTVTETVTAPTGTTGNDDRLAHLVLRESWPVALCGATVRDHLGASAPGRDRCPTCITLSNERGLGRPAWSKPKETDRP